MKCKVLFYTGKQCFGSGTDLHWIRNEWHLDLGPEDVKGVQMKEKTRPLKRFR
jgi:hypothetical protein